MCNMSRLSFISTLAICYLYFAAGHEPCSSPTDTGSRCVSIHDCKSLVQYLRKPTQDGVTLLRNSMCQTNEERSQFMVCCPPDTCTTPDGVQGTCVDIRSCSHVMNKLISIPTEDDINYVYSLSCGNPAESNVCCSPPTTRNPEPPNNNANNNAEQKCNPTAVPPDPSSKCCGLEASLGGTKIFGGSATAIDDYPWLAVIEYLTDDNQTEILCGGVLISGQYVLTASHCIEGSVLNIGNPVNVRLGEYNTTNPGEDCVRASGGGDDCTDGEVTVPIDKIISKSSKSFHVALIKLVRIVEFTDFIRPICLPSVDFTTTSPANVELYSAGWGMTENGTSSNVKLEVSMPYVPIEECKSSYFYIPEQDQLWDRYICAGGMLGKDTCHKDSGGPLMRLVGDRYELVGIVNFGPSSCGDREGPGVYAKVFYYLPWIRSEIE